MSLQKNAKIEIGNCLTKDIHIAWIKRSIEFVDQTFWINKQQKSDFSFLISNLEKYIFIFIMCQSILNFSILMWIGALKE